MTKKYLYLVIAIVLISATAAAAVLTIDNGLATRSSTETTDSLAALNVKAYDNDNNPPRLPEVNYSWDPNQEYYVPDLMNGHIYGKIEVDIPGSTELELRTAIRLLNPGSWALVEYITIELTRDSSSSGTVILYSYNGAGNVSGNPVDTTLVTTGTYDFHMHVKYRAALRMDPTDYHGKELQSDIIFTLEENFITVNYSINAGANSTTAGEMPTQKITKMKSRLNLNNFTNAGYAFAGWSKTDGSSVDYLDGATVDVASLIASGTTVLNLKAVWKTDGLYNGTDKTLYATAAKVRTDTADGIHSGNIYYVGKNTDLVIKGSDKEGRVSNAPILILLRENVTVDLIYPESPATDSAMVCFFNVGSVIGDRYVLNSANGLGNEWYDGSTNIVKEQTAYVEYYSLSDSEKAEWGQWTYEAYRSNNDNGQTVNVRAESSKVINVGSNKDMVFTKAQYDITGTWTRIGAYSGKTVTFVMDGFTGTVSSGEGGSTLPVKDEIMLSKFTGTVEVKSNYYVKITGWTSGSAIVEKGTVLLEEGLPGTHDLKYRVAFSVTDGSQPVKGVSVTFNGSTLITDSEGKAKFTSINGTFSYSVTKLGYDTDSGDITIDSAAQEKDVTLSPTLMYYNVEEKTLYATMGDAINQIKHDQTGLTPGSVYYFSTDMDATISTLTAGREKPILILVEEGVRINVMYPDTPPSGNTISLCFYSVKRSIINDNVYTFTKGLGVNWYDSGTNVVRYDMSDTMIVDYHDMSDEDKAKWGEWVYEPYQAYGDGGQIVYVKSDLLRGILNVGTNRDMIYTKSNYYMSGSWMRIGALDGKTVTFVMDGFTGTASSGKDTGSLGIKDEIALTDFVGTVVIESNARVSITKWVSGTVLVKAGTLTISEPLIKASSLRINVTCTVNYGGAALQGATVDIADVSGDTDALGKVTLGVPYGSTLPISVSASGKSTYESTIDVVLSAISLPDIELHDDGYYDSAAKKLYVSADKVIEDPTDPIQSGHIYYFTESNDSVTISASSGAQDKPILVLLKKGARIAVTYPSDAATDNSAMVCFFSVEGTDGDAFTFTNGLGSEWYDGSALKDLTTIGRISYYALESDAERNAWGEWVYEPYRNNGDNGQTVYAEASAAFNKTVIAGGDVSKDLVFTKNSYDMTGTYGRIGAYAGRTVSFNMSGFTGTVSSGAGSGELPENDEVLLVDFTGVVTVIGGTSIDVTTWTSGDVAILNGSLANPALSVPAGCNYLNMDVGTALDTKIGWLKTNLYNQYDQQLHELTSVEKGYYYVDLGVAKNVQSVKIHLTTYTSASTFRLSIGQNSFVEDKVYYISENHLFVATVFVGLYPSIEINENGVQLNYSTVPATTELTSTIDVYAPVSGFSVSDPDDPTHYDKKLTLPRTNGGDHGSVSIVPDQALAASSVILCKINYDYGPAPIESYAFTTADPYNEGYCIALYILYGKDLSSGAYSGSHLAFTYYVMGAGYDTLNFELTVAAPSP